MASRSLECRHTHFVVGMHVRLSFLYSYLLNAINVSHAQNWTGVVDAYLLRTHSLELVRIVGMQFFKDSYIHTSMAVDSLFS